MKWVSTFKYLPIEFDFPLAKIENRTMKVSFPNNVNGNKVRLLLSNRYAAHPLKIQRMTVGEEAETGREERHNEEKVTENKVAQKRTEDYTAVEEGGMINLALVTLGGKESFELKPDEEVFSDEIELEVHAGSRLVVSVYIKEPQEIESICGFSTDSQTRICWNEAGDAADQGMDACRVTADRIFPPEAGFMFYGFSAVQVYTDNSVRVLAMFGDSITHMSFVFNELMGRLYKAYPGEASLINCGISGNRLVHDATCSSQFPSNGKIFGKAGLSRFERDVFGIDDTDLVLVLEGINDTMHPIQFEGAESAEDPEKMKDGFNKLVETAHAHGARIFGATITPAGNDEYPKWWIPAFEKTRNEVNEWLLSASPFDGVFDYDRGVRDDHRPGYMREECSIGDGLHPNAAGAVRMVDQIDLEVLMAAGEGKA